MSDRDLVVRVLREEVGPKTAGSVDSEVVNYTAGLLEYHDPTQPLLPSLMMLEDFIGADATARVASRLQQLKWPQQQQQQQQQQTTLLGQRVDLSNAFVDAPPPPSSAVVMLADALDHEEGPRRKERRAKEGAAAGGGGPSPHTAVDKMTFRRRRPEDPLAPDLHLRHVDLNFGSKDGELHLSRGRRYGLVGRNGMGKTTLMRAISGREVDFPRSIRVLHVEQEASGDDTTALDCVLAADVERTELLAQEKGADAAQLERIYERLQEIEADSAPARAAKILHGLGFDAEKQKMKTREFSGGWRMRLALARALFCEFDLLLLDEPTNNLDYKSKLWLQRHLSSIDDKTLLIVSHDRAFLNSGVVQHIVHLHECKLAMYKGDYDAFEETRSERLRQQARAKAAQDAYVSHIQQFIDRFRYNAKRASLVQSRIKALSKLQPVASVLEDPEFRFSFPQCDELQGCLVEFRNVSFAYPGQKPLFEDLNISFQSDSRICITGQNGQGKTTVLKLLLGDIEPTSGEILTHPRLRIGRFSQHHVDQLDLGTNSVEFLRKHFPGYKDAEYRAHLGRYGLSGDLGLNPVSTLSGGQKSRLVFAWMSFQQPHLMVLDEPENHLDIDTVDALAVALNDYNGAVVCVSHDERLVSLCMNEMWVVHEGKCKVWSKDWDAYKRMLERELDEAK